MARGDDPVSRDIFQHQACGIAEEMSVALRRASFSSIIWDMHDYACGLFTPDAEMIAQADTIPAQLGVMSNAILRMFEEIPRDEWRPGDIIICNDPYRGCAHTMDVCLFSPVFHRDVLVAITSSIAHHADIGGRLPGSTVADNTEVFAEGIILPPLKLFAEGRPDPAILSILSSNVRLPDASKGDLRAQVAACRIGERRILELAELHGRETFTSLSRACLDYAEAYTRRAIADTPDGESEASTAIEDDITSSASVELRVRAIIDGDNLEIDLSDPPMISETSRSTVPGRRRFRWPVMPPSASSLRTLHRTRAASGRFESRPARVRCLIPFTPGPSARVIIPSRRSRTSCSWR